jgi:hypothetical protein
MAIANPTETRAVDRTATRQTRIEKGMSLARGPALILGTILLAAGLYLLYRAHTFPKFSNFPNGNVVRDGKFIFGLFAANGWTAMLTAVAGGLLLFGAAQHLLAKTMSLIVGVVLAAAAIIGIFNSGNVLGLAAANGWTELAWGASAVILLFNTLVPRRRREVVVQETGVPVMATREPVTAIREPVAAGEPVAARQPVAATREPVAAGEPVAATRQPVAATRGPVAASREPVATREPVTTREPVAGQTTDDVPAGAQPGAAREPVATREDGTPVEGADEDVATQQTSGLRRP